MTPKKYILTGGPNSGKSSITDLLAKLGFCVLEESSRLLIQTKLLYPWDNQEVFCEAFRQLQIKMESGLTGEIAFLDRSLIDPIANAEVAKCNINRQIYYNIENANYERDVFFFEMLPNYTIDPERRDTPDQAAAVAKQLRKVYERLGYRLIDVPLFSTDEQESKDERLRLILNRTIYCSDKL